MAIFVIQRLCSLFSLSVLCWRFVDYFPGLVHDVTFVLLMHYPDRPILSLNIMFLHAVLHTVQIDPFYPYIFCFVLHTVQTDPFCSCTSCSVLHTVQTDPGIYGFSGVAITNCLLFLVVSVVYLTSIYNSCTALTSALIPSHCPHFPVPIPLQNWPLCLL